jgi:hypothetical protein
VYDSAAAHQYSARTSMYSSGEHLPLGASQPIGLALRVSTTGLDGVDIRLSGKMALFCSAELHTSECSSEDVDERDDDESERDAESDEDEDDEEAARPPYITPQSLRQSREVILDRAKKRTHNATSVKRPTARGEHKHNTVSALLSQPFSLDEVVAKMLAGGDDATQGGREQRAERARS